MKGALIVAKRKYEHRHLITRTISTTSGDITFFDTDEKVNKTEHIIMSGKYTVEQFLKAARVDGIVLMAENVVTESKLYGITLENFLEHAEEITD